MTVQLKVGGDPEIFLKDTKTGEYVSAHEYIPGSKKEPHKVDGGAVQPDGVALEINIDPATTGKEFADNIQRCLDSARKFVPDHIAFDFTPAIDFPVEGWRKLPDKVKELGCDPDYSGDHGTKNPLPRRSTSRPTLCTGSGHLALGWQDKGNKFDSDHFENCQIMSRRLGHYFANYRFLWDRDVIRQSLYGSGNPFRPKDFGIEYRALSNAWLKYPKLWPWLFDSCKYVFDHAAEGKSLGKPVYGIPNPHTVNYRDVIGYAKDGRTQIIRRGAKDQPIEEKLKLINPWVQIMFEHIPPQYPSECATTTPGINIEDIGYDVYMYPVTTAKREAIWKAYNG